MNSPWPYFVLAILFVSGIVITVVGGILRLFGVAFAVVAFVLLIALFVFSPPDE